MQDMMHNDTSAALTLEGYEHGTLVFPRETTRGAPEISVAAVPASDTAQVVTQEELARLKSPKQLLALLQAKALDVGKINSRLDYERELKKLQIELVKMQRWVQEKNKRVAIIVEGRDAAGKGWQHLLCKQAQRAQCLLVWKGAPGERADHVVAAAYLQQLCHLLTHAHRRAEEDSLVLGGRLPGEDAIGRVVVMSVPQLGD